ncbi:MAG: molybdenum cofactor guanylyltransferase [Ectobacillus sp.]
MKIAGIILAGGRSRRFGEPKALACWNGKTFLSYALEALYGAADEIVVISHLSEIRQLTDVKVVEDVPDFKGQGPLAGILSGIQAVQADWYFVLPCDVPLVTARLVRTIVQQAEKEAVVPVSEGRTQPLIAIYHHSIKDRVHSHLSKGKRSMQELLLSCDVKYVTEQQLGVPPAVFFNVNTKEEYKQL